MYYKKNILLWPNIILPWLAVSIIKHNRVASFIAFCGKKLKQETKNELFINSYNH